MDADNNSLPLGAQHQNNNTSSSTSSSDVEEQDHFNQVCQSYQQYATFHQTRQLGINRRMCQLINSSRSQHVDINNDIPALSSDGHHYPTIESILPPSLHPKSAEYQQYQQTFNQATIQNQYYLDNILKYSGVPTSQDVIRNKQSSSSSNNNNNNLEDDASIEWLTEDQISKIDSVLKSVARDWSNEGENERSIIYDRIVNALQRYMPVVHNDDGSKKVQQQQQKHCCADDNCISNMNAGETNGETDNTTYNNGPPRVAVPGSGLGRLAWEIYSLGYSVEGSDFSLPMLLASDFMLNGCGGGATEDGHAQQHKQFGINPWIAETKNIISFEQRIRTVIVPDVDPTSLLFNARDYDDNEHETPEFTMLAGEFLHLYSHFLPENRQIQQHNDKHNNSQQQHPKPSKQFHAIACSFFLDTAPSLPHYLLTIYHMLQEDGLLINFGPLMYHWSGHGALLPGDDTDQKSNGSDDHSSIYQKRTKHLDNRYLTSIDYTWDEVKYMIVQCGFEIVEEEIYIPARYTSDNGSMMKVVYDCVFLVARKKKN